MHSFTVKYILSFNSITLAVHISPQSTLHVYKYSLHTLISVQDAQSCLRKRVQFYFSPWAVQQCYYIYSESFLHPFLTGHIAWLVVPNHCFGSSTNATIYYSRTDISIGGCWEFCRTRRFTEYLYILFIVWEIIWTNFPKVSTSLE